MKKLIFLFLASPCLAGGPKYTGTSTPTDVRMEVENIYHDIANPAVNVGTASTMTITNLSITHISSGPFSNRTSYTPTFEGLGTVSNTSAFWWRIGDTLYVQGYTQAGTVSANPFTVSLPTGLTIDTSKQGANSIVGIAVGGSAGLKFFSGDTGGVLFYDGSATGKVFASLTGTTTMTKVNGSSLLGTSNELCSFKFDVPISGWSF